MASEVEMATGANIKQGNSRSSSTIFLCLQGIGSSCPCKRIHPPANFSHNHIPQQHFSKFHDQMGEKRATCSKQHFFLNKILIIPLIVWGKETGQSWHMSHRAAVMAGGFWVRFSPQMSVTNSLSTRTALFKCWHKMSERATASTPVLPNEEFSSNPLAHGRAIPATAGHSAPWDLPGRGRKWGSESCTRLRVEQPSVSCTVIPRWTFLALWTAHPAIHVTGNEW